TDLVTVKADVVETGSGLSSVILSYRVNSGIWTNSSMTLSGTSYSISIPAQASNAVIEYLISASDIAGNSIESAIFTYTISQDVTTESETNTHPGTSDDETETDDTTTDPTSSETDPVPGFGIVFSIFMLLGSSVFLNRKTKRK
ncbi:MAG: hypothetical protein GPJ54_21800, partial [Candidatus Heimdallarchaeota archaeon]|nr:hypothetical protein [Candidatus Heimdallarchaeota archaeon]